MRVTPRVILFVTCALIAGLAAAPWAGQSAARRDVRGLWVLRTSLGSPDRVRAMVQHATRAGVNVLLVQVRGRGEAYYRSRVDPRAADLAAQPAGFDPLAMTIDLAHDAGIEVHAWVNVNLVSSAVTLPATPTHVLRRHPEWLMVPAALAGPLGGADPRSRTYVDRLARWTQGELATVEGLFLSPVLPAARAYSTSVVEELVRSYPLDGLHLDYIRYPREDFDYSRTTLEAFRADRRPFATEAERRRLDASTDLTAWTRAFPDGWRAFRESRLTTLVADLASTARRHRPGITVSAAVLPDEAEARRRKLQPWAAWAADGLLDVVCPMAYTQDGAIFAAQMASLTTAAGDTPFWAGIGAYRLPTRETASNIRTARRAGASGVLIYSYDGLLAAGRPPGSALAALRPVLLEDQPGTGRD